MATVRRRRWLNQILGQALLSGSIGRCATKELKKGDKVRWNTSQGETHGVVVRKLTAPMDIKGHHVAASADEPQFLVRSDKSDEEAAHKPDALKRA